MSPRRAEQYEQLKQERRQALLRAARGVFARKGLAAAKIGDVAAEAEISHGLIYHYFPHKEALFAAVVEETVQSWEALVAQARQRPGPPWERLTWLCEQTISGMGEAPAHMLVIVHAFTEDAAPREVRTALERYNRQVNEQLAALIAEGQHSGAVAPGEPAELARALVAMLQGLTINRIVDANGAHPSAEVVLRLLRR
jgi:AcrR family transcriptional regulator